jgi:hypothetical protein
MFSFLRPMFRVSQCALLVVWLASNVKAQTPEPSAAEIPTLEKAWRIGLKGGLSLSRYYGDSLAFSLATSQRMGFSGGAQFAWRISDNLRSRAWLQVEALFVTQGVQREFTFSGKRRLSVRYPAQQPYIDTVEFDTLSSVVYRDFIGTLQIPVLLKADFGISNVKPYVAIGPTLGLNLFARSTRQTEGNYFTPMLNANGEMIVDLNGLIQREEIVNAEETTDSTLANLSTAELGSTVLAGVLFPIRGNTALFIEGRYSLSWTKAFTNEGNGIRNQSILFLLGLEF